MARPLIILGEKILERKRPVKASEMLRPYTYQLSLEDPMSVFVNYHIGSELDLRTLMLSYLESFPLLLDCEYQQ